MTFDLSKLSDQALSELVLDYVRGTASDEATVAIEARLEIDRELADEVAYLQGLHRAVSPLKKDGMSDELGWRRLSKAIASESGRTAANDNAKIWKYAAAAFAVVAAIQTAILIQPSAQNPTETYVTASANDADTHAVNIIFNDATTADDITRVLNAVNGEFVAGPSALGLYTIAFETEAARDDALQALQAETDIIESVSLK